ncbi:hypothetical protein B8W66_17280 [Mycobacterium decipiens]|uniref:Uncharacterized protein n=1 Tax=Mycobacterium decipiens TaxID=1430326 RepID=A0A1X2LRP6_9MYCO|nr:hypothetical protein B8W66_17280 [Mycobacterium decipiens]
MGTQAISASAIDVGDLRFDALDHVAAETLRRATTAPAVVLCLVDQMLAVRIDRGSGAAIGSCRVGSPPGLAELPNCL